jgi:subtilisin-like proprotein convertase family protein
VRHEHGHGLGFNHVDPLNETKLMEAQLTTAFDGIQEDDLRGSQRFYGDWLETNSTAAEATVLGALPNGVTAPPLQLQNLAVEGPTSVDLFRFQVPEFALLKYDIAPDGSEYVVGPQGDLVAPIDGRRGNDLAADILLSDGVTVIAEIDSALIGSAESGSFPLTPGAGDYFLRVRSASNNEEVQRYTLAIGFEPGSPEAEWESLDAVVDDDAGNGNGKFDPGETGIRVRVPVRNIGFSEGGGLEGRLVSLTPTVTVRDAALSYGSAEPGVTLNPAPGFLVDVSNAHVCGEPVELQFFGSSPAGSIDESFRFSTGQPGIGSPMNFTPLGPRPIPPGDLTASRIAVADAMIIGQVRITGINITYPQMSDLLLYLQSPSGTVIILSNNSFSGPNLVNTTLSDTATTAISQGTSPYTGEFIPEGSLSELIGENSLGFWDLGVFNLLGSSGGSITTWTLEISPVGGFECEDVPEPVFRETFTIY